jgi:hypothetical protein
LKNLHLKIYIVSTALLDLLDETEGDTRFKNKLKFHINKTIKELEKITGNYSNNETNELVNKVWTAVEEKLKELDYE